MLAASFAVLVILGTVVVWLLCYFTNWTVVANFIQSVRATEQDRKFRAKAQRIADPTSTKRSKRRNSYRHGKNTGPKYKKTDMKSPSQSTDEDLSQEPASRLKEKLRVRRRNKQTQLNMYNEILQWTVLPSARQALHNYIGNREERKAWLRELLERLISSHAAETGDTFDQFLYDLHPPSSSASSRGYPTIDELVISLLQEENDRVKAGGAQLVKLKIFNQLRRPITSLIPGRFVQARCKNAASKLSLTLVNLIPHAGDGESADDSRRIRRPIRLI